MSPTNTTSKIEHETHPTTLVILGATGDLAKRKLFLALLDLFIKELLPPIQIVGFSKDEFTHEEFRAFVRKVFEVSGRNHAAADIEKFLSCMFYIHGDLIGHDDYQKIATFLEDRDTAMSVCSNKLFYLAVPPSLYKVVFERLAQSGLTIPCVPGENEFKTIWTRILVEKPFGDNQKEAQELDLQLSDLFEDDQIFRIDHYLDKEAIENILAFRFSNSLFEPVWNAEHIEKIEIRVLEQVTAGNRGAFYEGLGALADVGQNHLLQMLTLVAMENPHTLEAKDLNEARVELLSAIKLPDRSAMHFVRGQYDGYLSERDVAKHSQVETYFKVQVEIDSPRWKGVPIVLESGKGLAKDRVDIRIHFKKTQHALRHSLGNAYGNLLTFGVQPSQNISLLIWAKKPGFDFELIPTSLSFSYEENPAMEVVSDAYERVLFDCIRGDHARFGTKRGTEEEWRIVSAIRDAWEMTPLLVYKQGSLPKDISKT